MKIQHKFILLGMCSLASVMIYEILDLTYGKKLEALLEDQQRAVEVVQRHMDGDMKHDASRGDVVAILFAARSGNAQLRQNSLKALEEDLTAFDKNVQANLAADIPEEIKEQLKKVAAALTAYSAEGRAIAARADDFAGTDMALERFERTFRALEESQDKASDLIVSWSQNTRQQYEALNALMDTISTVLNVILILLSLAIPLYAYLSIFRPQGKMMQAMEKIAGGETDAPIPYTERKDEMGEMARTVEVFKENALKVARMASERKDMDRRAAEEKRQSMENLAQNFEANVKNVVDMVASAATEMDATARQVAGIADTSKQKLGTLTHEVGQATYSVQSVASAASQLSSAITEINRQVSRATSITSSAVDEAQQADNTVQQLVEASGKIGEVVDMINSIAEQINLLALNATIEAARAGDAGKGFAVVASEVKTLANQTTKATGEISSYISSIQTTTSDTVNVIRSISGTIREINEISTTIAAAVEEQGAATQNIAANVQQAASSTQDASRDADSVSSSANETGEAATQMTAATSELSRQAEILRHEVDKFLTGVRTAA